MSSFRRVLIASVSLVAAAAVPAHAAGGVVVYRSTGSSAIVEADVDGTGAHTIAHGTWPAISPDASQLAFGNAHNQLELETIGLTPRTLGSKWNELAQWSPDGQRLGVQFGRRLEVIPVNGGPAATVATLDEGALVFDPTSTLIALDGFNNTNKPPLAPPLTTASIIGASPRHLTEHATDATGLCWSSTNLIAFARDSDGNAETSLIHPDGSGLQTLALPDDDNDYPIGFSDDGSRLLLVEKTRHSGQRMAWASLPDDKIHPEPGTYYSVNGISHDGKQALAERRTGSSTRTVIVDLAGGKTLVSFPNADESVWTS